MKARKVAIWSICILVVLAESMNCMGVGGIPAWMISVPSARDARLAGGWAGLWGNRTASFVLYPNGTGLVERFGRVEWGTKGRTLYLKFRSAGEGYESASADYRFEQAGRTVVFRKRHLAIPDSMYRVPTSPSKLLETHANG